MAFGVVVRWKNGRQVYLETFPSGHRLEFSTQLDAEDTAEILRANLLPDDATAVSVVPLEEGHPLRASGMGRTTNGLPT